MAVLEVRRRTGWLFVLVVLAHIVLISRQVTTERGIPVFDTVVFGLFSEVERASTTGVDGVRSTWQDYFALQQIRRENESLKEEVAQLRLALQQERTLAEQSRGFRELLELKRELPLETTAARVIGGGASAAFQTITIDKGTQDGLTTDMAVIAPEGVVGRIVQVAARAAKVQLLIDSDAAAGAVVERSRVKGVVEGTGRGLVLRYITGSADIVAGDRLVTSGIDGIYPPPLDPLMNQPALEGNYSRGLVIGHIESFRKEPGQYEDIVVRPAVDFASLETVLVVLTRPANDATADADNGAGEQAAAARDGRR
jgi:rod shape-determining protein MreC